MSDDVKCIKMILNHHRLLYEFNTQRHSCCHFTEDIFKCIFLNENVRILIKISLYFFLMVQYSSFGSDSCLASTRRQAIIWTNDGWFIDAYVYVPLGLNDLKESST